MLVSGKVGFFEWVQKSQLVQDFDQSTVASLPYPAEFTNMTNKTSTVSKCIPVEHGDFPASHVNELRRCTPFVPSLHSNQLASWIFGFLGCCSAWLTLDLLVRCLEKVPKHILPNGGEKW